LLYLLIPSIVDQVPQFFFHFLLRCIPLEYLYDGSCLLEVSFTQDSDAVEALFRNPKSNHLQVTSFGMKLGTFDSHVPFPLALVAYQNVDTTFLVMSHFLASKAFCPPILFITSP
jgi:hypothetical protein